MRKEGEYGSLPESGDMTGQVWRNERGSVMGYVMGLYAL